MKYNKLVLPILIAGLVLSTTPIIANEANTPKVEVDDYDYSYLSLNIREKGYVAGISSITCNDRELEEVGYKIGLNSDKYYLDKDNDKIYFDSFMGIPFKSGDIITIKNPQYEDIVLQAAVEAGKISFTQLNVESGKPSEGVDTPINNEKTLYVRLVGSFEVAIVNQKGYDAISSASTNITQNKNSDVEVQVALVDDEKEVQESDWKPINQSNVKINGQKATVNLDPESGMRGAYSPYDSSITLAGTPLKAGNYPVSVTIVDNEGHEATSNELIFTVHNGTEYLDDQLKLENCTQTADGKYMYDMNPWAIANFTEDDSNIVVVPEEIKAWYGSHTSGTYGKLGYSVKEGTEPKQILVIPSGCNLTLVNMDVLSSVKIIVEDGGELILRDSTVQGIVEVNEGGAFAMNYNYGKFLTGASINGQLILNDGATLKSSKIYSNTNFVPNGNEARHNIKPVVTVNGTVEVDGTVYIKGDEAPSGIDPSTGKSYSGQQGLSVNGELVIPQGSSIAVYGGGKLGTTSIGGNAISLNNGKISGEGQLVAIGGKGTFDNGGNAVAGYGSINVGNLYLEGGNTCFPKKEANVGKALNDMIEVSAANKCILVDGKVIKNSYQDEISETYWNYISDTPDMDKYLKITGTPAVKVSTENTASIEQEYTIAATNGTIDLSKLKIQYNYSKDGDKKQDFYCDYAGMSFNRAPWYADLTSTVKGKFVSTGVEISFDKMALVQEGESVNMKVRFNQADWSDYKGFKENKITIIYDGESLK